MKHVLFLLGHLNDMDVEWMIDNGSKSRLEAGDRLISKKESIESLHIILSGQCAITDGESHENIALIGAGEVVGEMSFLESELPQVSVIATEDTEVYSISKELMNKRLASNLEFKANFYYAISLFLSNRIRKTTSQLGYGNPDEVDSLDENILDGISQAGSRFSQILQKFSEV